MKKILTIIATTLILTACQGTSFQDALNKVNSAASTAQQASSAVNSAKAVVR